MTALDSELPLQGRPSRVLVPATPLRANRLPASHQSPSAEFDHCRDPCALCSPLDTSKYSSVTAYCSTLSQDWATRRPSYYDSPFRVSNPIGNGTFGTVRMANACEAGGDSGVSNFAMKEPRALPIAVPVELPPTMPIAPSLIRGVYCGARFSDIMKTIDEHASKHAQQQKLLRQAQEALDEVERQRNIARRALATEVEVLSAVFDNLKAHRACSGSVSPSVAYSSLKNIGLPALLQFSWTPGCTDESMCESMGIPLYDTNLEALFSSNSDKRQLLAPQRLLMASDICSGLVAIHALGYIHRDLKPNNIVASFDKGGNLWRCAVIDFGNAVRIPHTLQVSRSAESIKELLPELQRTGPGASDFVNATPSMDVLICCARVFRRCLFPRDFLSVCYATAATVRTVKPAATGRYNPLIRMHSRSTRPPQSICAAAPAPRTRWIAPGRGDAVFAEINSILDGCMSVDPESRPTFTQLKERFEKLFFQEVEAEAASVLLATTE